MLDGKENELKVVLEELECERGKERALQAQQEEQQLRHLQREGQSSRALEVTGFLIPYVLTQYFSHTVFHPCCPMHGFTHRITFESYDS